MKHRFTEIKEVISKSSLELSMPILLFGVAFMGFGLLIPKLGFYMDDWPYIYYAYAKGIKYVPEMLFYDSRPYAGWLYQLFFYIFGFKPLYWQLSTLFFRWLAAWGMWLFLKGLWPSQKRLVSYAALLFVVYPFFLMQPLALGSTHHWVGFSLYFFSLLFMVKAFKATKRQWVFFFVALLLEVIHLFSAEYFSGLEVLRFFVLWWLCIDCAKGFLGRLWETLKRWFPYLIVLGVYFYWRLVLFEGPPRGDRNTPVLVYDFLKAPLSTLFSFIVTILKDSSILLFRSWNTALSPDVFDLTSFFTRFVFLIIVFSALGLYFLLKWGLPAKENNQDTRAIAEIGFLGTAALIFGTLPLWVIGKGISTHTNQMAATRFGIPAMFGAAIIIALLVDFFITDVNKENLAISLLIALSIGVHLQNGHLYENAWKKQKNFYYQLTARIPALEENTAIISAGEILPFMGEYPTSLAINVLYDSRPSEPTTPPYWFSSVYASYFGDLQNFLEGRPLSESHIYANFEGNSKNILFISFEPELGQCLWVLRPEDASLRLISELERDVVVNSSLDRILFNKQDFGTVPQEIFGPQVPNSWCIYYQKADLARQRNNWAAVVALWEEAQSENKAPANGFEYIPFIEGYAHQNNWTQVKKLTRTSNKISQGMYHSLCPTLQNLKASTPASSERDAVISDLYDYLKCQ